MEDISIRNLYSKIDALELEVKALREKAVKDIVIARLEQYCFELKKSIIDADLKIPDILVFRRYICQLADESDIMYVASLLRQCWRYANPQALVDAPVKPLPQEDLLGMALSKYSGKGNGCSADTFNETYNALLVKHASKKRDLSYHNKVLREIYRILSEVGSKQSIFITPAFLSYRTIISPLSQAQLSAAYDILVSEGCTRSQDRESFLASFSNSLQARQSQVCWLAINPKNRNINYAKLYAFFKIIQVELSESAKSVITETFVAADGGALKASSLKERENTQELRAFRDKLAKAIE